MNASSQIPALKIRQPGLLATVQDCGRFGFGSQGVSRGGAVDERAFLWANKLLGNAANAAAIEITLGGFKATALTQGFAVVCGAPAELRVNGAPQATWQVFAVQAGDDIDIQAPARGLRCYLAMAGGFQVPLTMGSAATVVRDGLGGLRGDGSPLRAGDELMLGEQKLYSAVVNRRPQHGLVPRVKGHGELSLTMVPLAHYELFEPDQQQRLASQTYRVTAQQDRMGVRLTGAEPLHWAHQQIISQPLPVGAIQIPPDGQPIVMLNDAQSLGGYPKVGVLSWASRMALAQAQAGMQVRFDTITLAQAQAELRAAEQFFGSGRPCAGSQKLRS